MTRDQAITFIAAALAEPDDKVFVDRLVIALDTIGLLAVAADPQSHGEAANTDPGMPQPIDPAANLGLGSQMQEASVTKRKRP